MSMITRKEFFAQSGKTVAAATATMSVLASARAAASERVRHAVIGCGGQGRRHADVFSTFEDCEVVALCDVDPAAFALAVERVPGLKDARKVEDYRRILDDPGIDSVSIATPDHWHTLIAIAALQAGKHVYVEKPCSHTVREGDALLAAAQHHGLCVQHGTHSRGTAGIQAGIEYLRSGELGKVRAAKAINHQLRGPIGRAPVEEPPAGVNYDLWTGPAPLRPFTRNRWHYNWHWFWDFGGGDLVNDGIHQVDIARWGLGVGLPNAVVASGAQYFYEDDHETPDTQMVTFEYDDCCLIYEMRLWTDYPMEGHDNGDLFYCDNGILSIGRRGVEARIKGEGIKTISDGSPDIAANMRNYLDCIKNGTPEKLSAPISEGIISSTLCNLGNIATRVGARLVYDAEKGECVDNDAANALLSREYREGYELPRLT